MDPSPYEAKQREAIQKWSKETPNFLVKGFGKLANHISSNAVEIARTFVPVSILQGAIHKANDVGAKLAQEKEILKSAEVSAIEELRYASLEQSDRLAKSVRQWAIASASVEGGASGFLGAVGMIADVPALLTLSLHTIHKIGLCYGYRATEKEDKAFVLRILFVACANSKDEKRKMLENFRQKEAAPSDTKDGETEHALMEILCKQIGMNFVKRKALQLVPLLGAAVGSAVNADFLYDVGMTATRIYQYRWLSENGKW